MVTSSPPSFRTAGNSFILIHLTCRFAYCLVESFMLSSPAMNSGFFSSKAVSLSVVDREERYGSNSL